MVHGFRPDARSVSRIGLGLVLLVLLVLPALLPERAGAQGASTPTPTKKIPGHSRPKATLVAPPLILTESVPTVVVRDVKVLNLSTEQLGGKTVNTTADLAFEDQFTATIHVQSPTSMLIGESRVITLEVIPELLAQAAMIRAELHALKFDSLDDGQPEKTVLVKTPVRWNWNIAPKEVGEQEFFLALSYIDINGSRVHWQNITLHMTVSPAATPTETGIVLSSLSSTPTVLASDTPIPTDTATPTWSPSPTYGPEVTPTFTWTPTPTFLKKVSDDVSDNPAPYLTSLVTLVLGLLGVYFQYIRKGDKGSGGRNKE